MTDYNAMQSIRHKLLLGEVLSAEEKVLWHEFIDTTVFEVGCKQLTGEKLSRYELACWELYTSVYPHRVQHLLTDHNLTEYGRFERGAPAAREQFEREYISTITPIEKPTGRRAKLLTSTRLQWAVPAAAVLVLMMIYPFVKNQTNTNPTPPATTLSLTIEPASEKASLTLANNTIMELDGTVPAITQGNTVVTTEKGILRYQAGTDPSALLYNTLTTPKGGVYHLVLSDGTNVWLNAGSSLSYPVAFTGSERKVKLEGEAYFEVAPNTAKHFWVDYGNGQVEVKGTHFNINSYTKNWKVALVEGAVDLHTPTKNLSLTQGEQAGVQGDSPASKEPLDTTALAWKEGYFHYNNTDIIVVLNDITRWYNLNLYIPERLQPQKLSTAKISRTSPLNNILNTVKDMARLECTLEGRTLVVKQQQ